VEWAQNATIKSWTGTPEVIRQAIKHSNYLETGNEK